jgi:hypothetical protein
MIRFFRFLLDGCWHRWEVYKAIRIVDSDNKKVQSISDPNLLIPIGSKYILRCARCGKMDSFETYS